MTEEEKLAEEYAKANAKKGLSYREVTRTYDEITGYPYFLEDKIKKAFLAGLEAGRPKWHDLRKDPNDLPLRSCIDNNSNVVRLFHNSWDKKLTWYRYDFHEREWWQMETEPIAWCEIPKYTEE